VFVGAGGSEMLRMRCFVASQENENVLLSLLLRLVGQALAQMWRSGQIMHDYCAIVHFSRHNLLPWCSACIC